MRTRNYHTHTHRCGHALGDVPDYCREAVRQGLDVLGFTDHTPLPDGRWPSVRMDMQELPGYLAALDDADRQFPDLLVLHGLECEYVEAFVPYYREEFLGRCGLDYLVGGAHWYPHAGEWVGIYGTPMDPSMLKSYADYLVAGMESGLFSFVAHPDLFGVSYPDWDRHAEAAAHAICQAAAALSVPLEINTYGFRKPYLASRTGKRPKYPWFPFWEMAATWDVPVVVSSDAHRPEDVLANMDQGEALARRLGLKQVALTDAEENARQRRPAENAPPQQDRE